MANLNVNGFNPWKKWGFPMEEEGFKLCKNLPRKGVNQFKWKKGTEEFKELKWPITF